jgi:tetratricopeptide (TPR) repeat protein
VDALTLKAALLNDDKKPAASLAYLEQAHALVPSDPELAYGLAYEYAEANNPKVITLTDSLIKAKAPEIEKAFYVRGLYYVNTNRGTEAMAQFDAAIRANYNFFDAYRDKGEWLLNNRQYDAALKVFTQALRVKPDIAEFYFLSGKALEAKGDRAAAKESYAKAYGLDRNLTEAKAAAERLD